MDDARSVAWKVVAGLVALFLLASALLWAFARTTPQQENANAAQAAGVTTQQNQSAEGDSNAAQPQSEAAAGATAEGATAQDGEGQSETDPNTGQAETEDGEEGALAGESSNTEAADAGAMVVHPAFNVESGEELYAAACQSCHMPGGVGADQGGGTKNYPALAGNANLQTPQYPATFILNGAGAMPSFADQLTDEQIAMLINYLRNDLNDFDGEVTPGDIEPLRDGARSTTLGDDAG